MLSYTDQGVDKLVEQGKVEQLSVSNLKYTITNRTGKLEEWEECEQVGEGAFSKVRLHKCIKRDGRNPEGDDEKNLRAVKTIYVANDAPFDYKEELRKLTFFSQSEYTSRFVQCLGWLKYPTHIWIFMDYYPDGDLQKLLTKPVNDMVVAKNFIHQILEGLDFMHDAGIAHRDLKPGNILVRRKGDDYELKIADFGLSKYATCSGAQLQSIVGTPEFCAPEILYLDPSQLTEIDIRAVDIFSLGTITYLILTGKSLFKHPGSLPQYYWVTKSLPSDTGSPFIKRLLAIDPRERPTTKQCLRHPWFHPGRVVAQSAPESPPEGHVGPVNSVVFSERDVILASGGQDGKIKFWDNEAGTGPPLLSLDTSLPVLSVAFSPNGSVVASRHFWTVTFWDVAFGYQLWSIKRMEARGFLGVAFLSDKEVMYANAHSVHILDLDTREELMSHDGFDGISSAAASQNGELIVAKEPKVISYWARECIQYPFIHHTVEHQMASTQIGWFGQADHIAVSADGRKVAFLNPSTAFVGPCISVWSWPHPGRHSTGDPVLTMEEPCNALCIALTFSGTMAAYGCREGVMNLWSLTGNARRGQLRGHTDFTSVACSTKFGQVAKRVASGAENGEVVVWEYWGETSRNLHFERADTDKKRGITFGGRF